MNRRSNHNEPVERLTVEDDLLILQLTPDILSRVGEIRNIDFPEEGDTIEKGDELVRIEGSEDDLHLKAPIAGIVIEINELFADHLNQHSQNPKHVEWIVKIEPQDPDDLLSFEE